MNGLGRSMKMLSRKTGDKVFINPYSNITGVIMDSKEATIDFHPNWEYKVKFDHKVNFGWGLQESEYYNDDELDKLLINWNRVKGITA
jgi:hypothetical protein